MSFGSNMDINLTQYHWEIVIEVMWKRIRLLGSENLRNMVESNVIGDNDGDGDGDGEPG